MSSPACCSPEKSMENSRLQAQRSNESPSGAFKRRSGLAQQDGGALPRQVPPRCTECRQCKEKHGFPAGVQKVCRAPENGKSHEESCDSSWDFGALEGTRIPGPLIKSQMLYRLSYERIHYKAQYNTILPNNITILPGKMQAFCTKNFPKAVIGQILPRTAPLQTGQEPVQSKQLITKLQPTCRAHFRAGQADPIGGLFP